MRNQKKLTVSVCLLILAIFSSCNKFSKKTIFSFNELSFNQTVNLGDSSDIIINKLPRNSITISKNKNDEFHIELKEPLYIKLNNDTKNKISLDTVNELKIKNNIINKSQLNSLLDDIERKNWLTNFDQNYLSLKILLLKLNPQSDTSGIKSIISRTNNVIILLDNNTIVNSTCKANLQFDVKGKELKVECYSTNEYSNYYANPKNKSKHFLYLDSNSHHILVRPLYTHFGSSELIFTCSGSNTLNVIFNKPYQFVIDNKIINNLTSRNKNIPLSLIQDFRGLDPMENIVIPKFSATQLTTVLNINTNDEIKINENFKVKSFNLLTLIICLMPLCLSFAFIIFMFNKSKFLNLLFQQVTYMSEITERKYWQKYFPRLTIIIAIYFLYRLLIAYNLYITAPYFTHFLPMQITIVPLALLFIFQLWVHFIKSYSIEENVILNKFNFGKENLKFNIYLFSFIGLIIIIICIIQNKLFGGILQNQLKFDFYLVSIKQLFTSVMSSSISPLLILLLTMILFYLSKLIPNTVFKYGAKNSLVIKVILLIPVFILNNAYSSILLLFFVISTIIDYQNEFQYNRYLDKLLYLIIDLIKVVIKSIINLINKLIKLIKRKPFSLELFDTLLIHNLNLFKIVIFNSILVFSVAIFKGDFGYIINTLPLILSVFWIIFITTKNPNQNINLAKEEHQKSMKSLLAVFIVILIFFAGIGYMFAKFTTSSEGRSSARFTALYRFENMEGQGLKKTEGISQFFVVLGKYLLPTANVIEEQKFHSTISGNYDPIVINDLSFPVNTGLLWGRLSLLIYALLIITWIYLFRIVHLATFLPSEKYNLNGRESYLHSFGIVKIICLFYLIGSGTWLLLSYFSILPFTGRLLFGFGQDSVAELLETIIIFTCFGLLYNKNEITKLKSKE